MKSKKGFTLTELLMAILLLSLITAGLVSGIFAATNVYQRSVVFSDSQTLSHSIMTVLMDEFRFSTNQKSGDDNPSFNSCLYGESVRVFVPDEGELAGKLVIGKEGVEQVQYSLINLGLYPENTKVNLHYSYDEEDKYYTIDCQITDSKGNLITEVKNLVIQPIS